MKPLTLQNRVAWWSAGLMSLGMLLCGAAIIMLAFQEELKELDNELRAEARSFFAEWDKRGGVSHFDLQQHEGEAQEWISATHLPRIAEVVDKDSTVLFRSHAKGERLQPGLGHGFSYTHWNGRPRRCGVFMNGATTLRLAADMEPILDLIRNLVLAFLLSLPLLLVFVVVGSRWVAHRALEPVRRITNSAEIVTAEQSDGGVPVPPASDEIQRLAVVLNATFARFRQSYQQAQRFSADASHELKTPLTVQRATIETLLESGEMSPEHEEAMSSLLEQTKRLSAITEGLLLLSRADAGKLHLDLLPADVSSILEACVEDAKILAESRSITIIADVPLKLLASVDQVRLSQIFLNLLDNGLKYNLPGGKLLVQAFAYENGIQVKIKNTGAGIPIQQQPQIFERFFRAGDPHPQPGQGLGLSIARELARAHGGELRLEEANETWTVFTVDLGCRETCGLNDGVRNGRTT